jgi:hypothetical protein
MKHNVKLTVWHSQVERYSLHWQNSVNPAANMPIAGANDDRNGSSVQATENYCGST